MSGSRIEEITGMRDDLIKKVCSIAMKAHESPQKQYLVEKSRSSSEVIFSFPGSWSAHEWFTHHPFGETKINLQIFPSMRSIGNDEVATVNKAFLQKFEDMVTRSSFKSDVGKAVKEKKQIVFTGHSSGGPIAILATVWFLEEYQKPGTYLMSPLCLTFGSPLVGDRIFNHALLRENWSQYFRHFVIRYDIVPRIFLAPLSSVERELHQVLWLLAQHSTTEASDFYVTVTRNVSTVASHAACHLKGNTNLLMETVSSFIELSPYRPSGTYVFCIGNGKLVVVSNPDAVLQILFYSSQLTPGEEVGLVAQGSLKEHWCYPNELRESSQMQNVTNLDNLEELPLTLDGAESASVSTYMTLNDLGLSTRGILCLRAAGGLEKHKLTNQAKVDGKKPQIVKAIKALEGYKSKCQIRKVGYYDALKKSEYEDDFHANLKRLELAGLWDEIIEMLKRYELPDGFENRKEWVDVGTSYRHMVEPLDIANYYRHLKNEDTGPYTIKGRPKRYKYTQRWLEHALRLNAGSRNESCFWAEVEELSGTSKQFEGIKESVLELEEAVQAWAQNGQMDKEVFLEESTFIKWWKTLPPHYVSGSCILGIINSHQLAS